MYSFGFHRPNITYKGQFQLDLSSGKLRFEGDVSQFPSIEAFVTYQKGKPIVLFQEPAVGTVINIGSKRHVSKEIALPIFDGKWKSTDSTGRFSIEIKDDDYTFSEASTSGPFSRQGKLQSMSDGRKVIYRANDADVLGFLKFSTAMISNIQSRSPQPSYIAFKRAGATIDGTWAGLEVIKDAKGNFKQMLQPGQAPLKRYEFVRSPT